jgi:dihydrofolate reductase
MISLVVAVSENNAIGKNNQLLWHLPNDLKFFKNTTWGGAVIMGRKTFESVNKPLPGRTNIVITKQVNWTSENVIVVNSIEAAIQKAKDLNFKDIFIIGGGEIYKESMSIADKIYLTKVHTTIEGDTYFPELQNDKWKMISNKDFSADEKHVFDYSFQEWVKSVD